MPFDLPECETELVGGYHTEYSSMKFALFFMGEYAAMVIGSALIVTLFLGGWSLGFGLDQHIAELHIGGFHFGGLIHLGVFLAKLVAFILFFILVRWTVPRFRYDQLMKLGWVIFFEAALINVFLAALILAAPNSPPSSSASAPCSSSPSPPPSSGWPRFPKTPKVSAPSEISNRRSSISNPQSLQWPSSNSHARSSTSVRRSTSEPSSRASSSP